MIRGLIYLEGVLGQPEDAFGTQIFPPLFVGIGEPPGTLYSWLLVLYSPFLALVGGRLSS
jgi:hypothetical protein